MIIHQFEYKGLAHYSYAIISNGKMALIDPERNPQPYYDFAKQNQAIITTVIETHPHADFLSSHAEIHHTTGATVYVSKLLSAKYPHHTFDDGDVIQLGEVELKALNTPGHSPDSISIAAYENGKAQAVFTGDTLFIGDCGRPDLREKAGAVTAARDQLARNMYHSLRDKLMKFADDVKVNPTHGAGSLCGRGLSVQNLSTIGAEKVTNWSLQPMNEDDFVKELVSTQPFVPKYFTNSVELNRAGGPDYKSSIEKIQIQNGLPLSLENIVVIDTRPQEIYKKGSLSRSINLMDDTRFETWLGSIIAPGELFYLIVPSKEEATILIDKIARIGYESQVKEVFVANHVEGRKFDKLNVDEFRKKEDKYTIVDIRNYSEVADRKVFEKALVIPLPELRERVKEIPLDKPLVVHCAAGYRSAAGVSIIKNVLDGSVDVYDLGTAITTF